MFVGGDELRTLLLHHLNPEYRHLCLDRVPLPFSLSASCSFHPQSILYCVIYLHILSYPAFTCHLPWAQSLDSNSESSGNSYGMREWDPWTDVLGIETEVRSPLVRGLAEASWPKCLTLPKVPSTSHYTFFHGSKLTYISSSWGRGWYTR